MKTTIMRQMFFLALFLLASTIGANANADNCKEKIDHGKSHFKQYHHNENENFEGAVTAYQEAAQSSQCAYEAYWRLSELHLHWGTFQSSKKVKIAVFEKGVEYANKAIKANPNGKEGHFFFSVNTGSLIVTEGMMGNLRKVKTIKNANETALGIDPNYAPSLVVKGRINHDMPGVFGGDDEKAEQLFRKAIACSPDYETAHMELAKLLYDKKRFDEAEACLTTLLAPSFPHSIPASWESLGKPEAEDLLKKIQQAKTGGSTKKNK